MNKSDMYKIIDEHYRENFKNLTNRYMKFTNSRSRSEDIVQEAYARACQFSESFLDKEDFNNWFSGILRNATKDAFKADRSQGITDEIENYDIPVKASAIPKIIYNEVVDRINKKEKNIAKILNLFLVQQYIPKEIAKLVPETANNIRQIVHQFRKEIRDEFKWKI